MPRITKIARKEKGVAEIYWKVDEIMLPLRLQWCYVEEPRSEVMAALDSTAGVEVVYVAALSPPASQASQLVENTLETPGLEQCGEEGRGKGDNIT